MAIGATTRDVELVAIIGQLHLIGVSDLVMRSGYLIWILIMVLLMYICYNPHMTGQDFIPLNNTLNQPGFFYIAQFVVDFQGLMNGNDWLHSLKLTYIAPENRKIGRLPQKESHLNQRINE